MKQYSVYKITNLINGKIYIGKTYDIKNRWKKHIQTARHPDKNASSFSYIHKAIRKYGEDKFTIEELCRFSNEMDALNKEIELIAEYKSEDHKIGYNLTKGGDGVSGYKYTDKQKQAISNRMKGLFVGDKNPFYGQKHSDETKHKISESRKIASKENYLGEKCSQAKLNNEKVIKIVKLFNEGYSSAELSKVFKVSRQTIDKIISGKTWNQITGINQSISKTERYLKTWNKKLGEIITITKICPVCEKEFTISQRPGAKKRISNYCNRACYLLRYKAEKARENKSL